jgi:hypothetical protein
MTMATDHERLSAGVQEGEFVCPACGEMVMLELPPDRVRRRPGFGPVVYSQCPSCETKLCRPNNGPRDSWRVQKASRERGQASITGDNKRLGESAGSRRACVFCGAEDRKISKEHLWSKWMCEHVEGGEDGSIGKSRVLASDTGKIKQLEKWPEVPFGQEISGPCKLCNESWMEGLEDEARPFLIPMLHNEPVALKPEAQRTVARWATLKLFIAHLAHRREQQNISSDRYRLFYADLSLPRAAQVWLGRYSGAGSWPTDYNFRELFVTLNGGEEPERSNAYLAGFTIGYLAFFYWGHELDRGPVADISAVSPYVTQIWPATGVASWPPPALLDGDGLRLVMERFPINGWV